MPPENEGTHIRELVNHSLLTRCSSLNFVLESLLFTVELPLHQGYLVRPSLFDINIIHTVNTVITHCHNPFFRCKKFRPFFKIFSKNRNSTKIQYKQVSLPVQEDIMLLTMSQLVK